VAKLIPEPNRLFYRNPDATKMYTARYMAQLKETYRQNVDALQKTSGKLLFQQKEKVLQQSAAWVAKS